MNLRSSIIELCLDIAAASSSTKGFKALEVGCMFKTNEGFSTLTVAKFMRRFAEDSRFISIDSEARHIESSKIMLSDFDSGLLSLVHFVHGSSTEVLPGVLNSLANLDFALLDGSGHPEICLQELEMALHHISPGSIVLVDDLQEVEPTVHYPSQRIFGKGTLILPLLVMAGYLKKRTLLGSMKGVSELISLLPAAELVKKLGDLEYVLITRGKHKMIALGHAPIMENLYSRLSHSTIQGTVIHHSGETLDSGGSPKGEVLELIQKGRPHEALRRLPAKERIGVLKDLYKGERAFIIGNGPSLNLMDLTKLKDEITFGVNSIFYNFDRMGFRPTFYVVEDKLVAEDRAEEINALTGMTKIFGAYLQYCLRDSNETVWTNTIFDFTDYPGFPHFSKDASQCLWVGGTVSYVCMQLAFYMGFKDVYLIGFDHKYAIPEDAEVDGTIITTTSIDPNHFHPDYFGKGKRWHNPRTDRMEVAYSRAKEVFELEGRQIYNATEGGYLEVFPRVDFKDLFEGKKEDHPGTGLSHLYACAGPISGPCDTAVSPGSHRFSHLVLDYTRLCNSRCTYCSIWEMKDGPELSLEAIKNIFISLQPFGLSACYLTGGEPYISDKVVEIAKLLHDYLPRCRISGATNAVQPKSILTRLQQIMRTGVPLEVHVSINGSEETHDSTRGRKGNWKNAISLMDTLKSWRIPVVASMSLMPQTIQDLPYLQELCLEKGYSLMFSWVRQSSRYGTVNSTYSLWQKEVRERLTEIEYLPHYFDCPGLSKRLVVTPEGDLFPCEVYHPEILLGNVNKESLGDLLDSPRSKAMEKMISSKRCHWCQGTGENEGSPKWMLMDCYRRHARQKTILAKEYLQAVDMEPGESRKVIEGIIKSSEQRATHTVVSGLSLGNMERKVLISAIICTYRNPELLGLVIESLLNQTMDKESFEIIVVDNNSMDSTEEVVRRYAGVQYVLEKQQGLSYARNRGIDVAKGDILAFIDDDAEASPAWLEELLKVFDRVPRAWAVGGKSLPIWDGDKPKWLNETYYRALSLIDWGDNARPLEWPERIIGVNCSFRKEVFLQLGSFKEYLGRTGSILLSCEDTEIQQRIHETGHFVYYTPRAVVYHHVPPSRMTRQYFEKRSHGNKLSERIIALINDEEMDEVNKIINDMRIDEENAYTALLLNDKGENALKVDNIDRACKMFCNALNFSPSCIPAHKNMSILYSQMGEKAKSIQHLMTALSCDRDNREVVMLLAETLTSANQIEEALMVYMDFSYHNPEDMVILEQVKALTAKVKDKICTSLGKSYFAADCHEKEVIQHLPHILRGTRIFVDIGASLGQYTFHASQIMKGGQILAIEADPMRFEELERNCEKWQSASGNRITALQAAVCEKDGLMPFYITCSSTSGGLFERPHQGHTPNWFLTPVKGFRLDTLFENIIPDLIKIDVEGSELRVLQGGTSLLRKGKTQFLIEVHSVVDPATEGSWNDIFRFMELFGYNSQQFYGRYLFTKYSNCIH